MVTVIKVKQGQLEGTTQKSILTGKEYFCFLGIPYAKPPIGELRFQPPREIEKWDGILNAKKEGSPCIQRDFSGEYYFGSEDCLYLNVFSPEQPSKNASLKAVMVFIHGGGFAMGSGSSEWHSPDYLMNYDVILVTLNYRLHALGFLDMGTKNCFGNCGLRDQCLAMKWVKENIKQFGGDPENITIFGESAGASSVYLQIISPLSKGLFNKAIIQSDIVSNLHKNRKNLPNTGFRLGQKLGYDDKDPEKLVEFLKKQPAGEICKQAFSMFEESWKIGLKDYFGPTPEIIQENAFLPDTYENLKKNAVPVPLIAGFNNKDGRIFFSNPTLIEDLKNNFKSVISDLPSANFDSTQLQDFYDKIKNYYLGDKPVSEEVADEIADLYTDYYFRDFYQCIDFMNITNIPVYIYEFSFFGKFNVYDKLMVKNIPASKNGACHADELPYLFYIKKLIPNLTEATELEMTVIKNMCSLWTNFAKSTNPTANLTGIEWRPFKPEKPCYLSIDKNLKLIEEKLRGKEFEFWRKLLE